MLPNTPNLQLAVISCLLNAGTDEISGRELRRQLANVGVHKDGPAFYQLMSRMEDAGLVRALTGEKVAGGHRIKERRYRLTGNGERAWEEAVAFASAIQLGGIK